MAPFFEPVAQAHRFGSTRARYPTGATRPPPVRCLLGVRFAGTVSLVRSRLVEVYPMKVSHVEVVVLGLLADEPRYGYDLLEAFRGRSMGIWTEIGKASVYQGLRRLERSGLVGGRSQAGTEGPDRRVYRITRAGRDRLRTGLTERFEDASPYETDAGVALGFLHLLSAAEARRALDARERVVRGGLDAIEAERASTTSQRGAGRTVSTWMLDRQESLAQAELAWIGSVRRSLSRLRR
jgi:DNA-binding PadR family transcriptional regulator